MSAIQSPFANSGFPLTPVVSGTPAANNQLIASSATAASWVIGLVRQATTGSAGFALQNATPTILTWTAPSDSVMHRAVIIGLTGVSSIMTGGQVNVQYTDMNGVSQNAVLTGAGLGTGTTAFNNASNRMLVLVPSGGTISIVQTSALTGGAATVWAEIWGSLCKGGTMTDPVQRGRYSVFAGDGGFVIGYTRGLCATCEACGCGDQADEPLDFTRKGIMGTVMRARKFMTESGIRLPMMAGMGGDGGPRRGRR